MKILSYFNVRTFLALLISQAAAYLAIRYQVRFHIDLLLFGLCVVFPLHFSMQAAFKRRERALEHFSLFKAGTMALYNSFRMAEDLLAEQKQEANGLLKGMSDQLVDQLEHRNSDYARFQQKVNVVVSFIERYREEISKRNVLRMVRYLKDVTESSSYLISLVSHRTMVGLRFYSIFFILIFPLVQAPIILYRLETLVPAWGIHVLVALTTLTLVTLSNFQLMIEYPFDSRGADNVRLRDFDPELI